MVEIQANLSTLVKNYQNVNKAEGKLQFKVDENFSTGNSRTLKQSLSTFKVANRDVEKFKEQTRSLMSKLDKIRQTFKEAEDSAKKVVEETDHAVEKIFSGIETK